MTGSSKKRLKVEKIGGFAGFGLSPNLTSSGEIDLQSLPKKEQSHMKSLLTSKEDEAAFKAPRPDGFRYRVSWTDTKGHHSREFDEDELPESVREVAQDRLK